MNVDLLCLYRKTSNNRYLVRIEWVHNNENIPNKLCNGYVYYLRYSKSFASPDDHCSIMRFRYSSFMGILNCHGYASWKKGNFCRRNFAYSILFCEII